MKKFISIMMCICLMFVFAGCSGDSVPQSQYNDLKIKYDKLQLEYDTVVAEKDELSAWISGLNLKKADSSSDSDSKQEEKSSVSSGQSTNEDKTSSKVASTQSEKTETPNSKEIAKEPKKANMISDGMHKVGTDIAEGEYLITSTSNVGGYYSVNSDSKGDSVIENGNFKTNSIVTVKDGQYLELSRSTACVFLDCAANGFVNGILQEGMYLIGKDIPASEYKVRPTSDLGGYYAVIENSSVPMKIVTNKNFKGETYLTVEDGQYLKLSRAELLE